MKLNLLITTYIESEYVQIIRDTDSKINVIYRPDIIPTPRFPSDHTGIPQQENLKNNKEWEKYLYNADILFDFDRSVDPNLDKYAPNDNWIQATSAGIGKYLNNNEYINKMPQTIFTTASGVHSKPLSEFCIMAILMFNKNYLKAKSLKQQKVWERFSNKDLYNNNVLIFGVGQIGKEVAKYCKNFGMNVYGIKKNINNLKAKDFNLDKLYNSSELNKIIKLIDYLILIAPATKDTNNIINHKIFSKMKNDSIVINISRGSLINEKDLLHALDNKLIAGAALDVFANEPLNKKSPFWNYDNVIIYPHSASTTYKENERITNIFCKNIKLFLKGKPLINQFNSEKGY